MATTNPKKELRALEQRLRAQGWTTFVDGGGHPRFVSPTGERVWTSATSHGGRGWANFLARLRRAGADLETDTAPLRAQRRPARRAAVSVRPTPARPAESVTEPAPLPVVVVAHDDREVRTLEDVPERMVSCRVLRHAWEPRGRGRSSFGVCVLVECLRCATVRRDLVSPLTGHLLSRQYVYPDAYHVTEKATGDAWRTRWVDELGDLPDVDVTVEPRHLRALRSVS